MNHSLVVYKSITLEKKQEEGWRKVFKEVYDNCKPDEKEPCIGCSLALTCTHECKAFRHYVNYGHWGVQRG